MGKEEKCEDEKRDAMQREISQTNKTQTEEKLQTTMKQENQENKNATNGKQTKMYKGKPDFLFLFFLYLFHKTKRGVHEQDGLRRSGVGWEVCGTSG